MQRGHGDQRGGAAHYETFVLRLWVEDAICRHGEIHHVQSTSSLRFENLQRALEFVTSVIDGAEARRTLMTTSEARTD